MTARERPILFSAPMVRAILEGRKTQTRRVVQFHQSSGYIVERGGKRRWHRDDPNAVQGCPYGEPGDLLWVRETWGLHDTQPKDGPARAHVYYRATDGDRRELRYQLWRPSIFMPRWASRITLRVTDVRVQRLQEISEEDARAEGVEPIDSRAHEERDPQRFDRSLCENCGGARLYMSGSLAGATFDVDCAQCDSHVKRLRALWDSINGKRAPWSSNPWVWAITFERGEEASRG